jgi:hypothetical protein
LVIEPIDPGDFKKLVARRQKKLPVPMGQTMKAVWYTCRNAEQEYLDTEGVLVDGSSLEISAEDLADELEAMEYISEVDGGVQISSHAPQSPTLARRLKPNLHCRTHIHLVAHGFQNLGA